TLPPGWFVERSDLLPAKSWAGDVGQVAQVTLNASTSPVHVRSPNPANGSVCGWLSQVHIRVGPASIAGAASSVRRTAVEREPGCRMVFPSLRTWTRLRRDSVDYTVRGALWKGRRGSELLIFFDENAFNCSEGRWS